MKAWMVSKTFSSVSEYFKADKESSSVKWKRHFDIKL